MTHPLDQSASRDSARFLSNEEAAHAALERAGEKLAAAVACQDTDRPRARALLGEYDEALAEYSAATRRMTEGD